MDKHDEKLYRKSCILFQHSPDDAKIHNRRLPVNMSERRQGPIRESALLSSAHCQRFFSITVAAVNVTLRYAAEARVKSVFVSDVTDLRGEVG